MEWILVLVIRPNNNQQTLRKKRKSRIAVYNLHNVLYAIACNNHIKTEL
jgi:hypothetical protein